MLRLFLLASALVVAAACDDAPPSGTTAEVAGCDDQTYAPASTSEYVLPYPVGTTYRIDLGNCSTSYHGPSRADRYAYDFDTAIGSLVTASRAGRVVHIEESGVDGGFPNNLVVVAHGDGTFGQYMHLTQSGADVAVGEEVEPGDTIGRSGNTGLAGSPHLHFVITRNGWRYPYDSTPVSFRNADPLATVLTQGERYRATER